MLNFFKSLFARPAASVRLADGIYLAGRDRDNWFISYGEKRTRVYAPSASLFSNRKLDFYGVIPDTWGFPFERIFISKDEKFQIEQALLNHLAVTGVRCTIMKED